MLIKRSSTEMAQKYKREFVSPEINTFSYSFSSKTWLLVSFESCTFCMALCKCWKTTDAHPGFLMRATQLGISITSNYKTNPTDPCQNQQHTVWQWDDRLGTSYWPVAFGNGHWGWRWGWLLKQIGGVRKCRERRSSLEKRLVSKL